MGRVINWDVELVKWAEQEVGQQFEWGYSDCCSLVRRALSVMYGRDLCAGTPPYRSLLGARRALQQTGGAVTVLKNLGALEVSGPGFLQTGDIAVGPPVEDDFAPNVFVVVSGQLLSAEVGGVVHLQPLACVSDDFILLRMPNG